MKNNIKKFLGGISAFVLLATNAVSIGAHAYNGNNAAYYANLYAEKYNSYYKSLKDNDCTNFVSQCLYNGGYTMSDTSSKSLGINNETSAWYHHQYTVWDIKNGQRVNQRKDWKISTTFIRVSQEKSSKGYGLYQYLTQTKGCTATEYTKGTDTFDSLRKNASVGDIIQCQKKGDTKSHSIIVTKVSSNDITVAYHSDDHKDRSFKTYFWNKSTYATYHLIKIK